MAARPNDVEWFKRNAARETGGGSGSFVAVSRRTVQPTPVRRPAAADDDAPKVPPECQNGLAFNLCRVSLKSRGGRPQVILIQRLCLARKEAHPPGTLQ